MHSYFLFLSFLSPRWGLFALGIGGAARRRRCAAMEPTGGTPESPTAGLHFMTGQTGGNALNLIPDRSQLLPNLPLQFMGLCEHLRKFGSQAAHFLFKRLAVVFLLLDTYVAAGGEDVILFGNVGGGNGGAEAFDVFKRAFLKGRKRICQFLNIAVGKIPVFAG